MNSNQTNQTNRPTAVPLDHAGKTGLTRQLRGMTACKMVKGELVGVAIELGKAKRYSVYELARKAEIKVTIRTIGSGKIRVWRLPDGDSKLIRVIKPILKTARENIGAEERQKAINAAMWELEQKVKALLKTAGYHERSYSKMRYSEMCYEPPRPRSKWKVAVDADKRRPGDEFVLQVIEHLLKRLALILGDIQCS